MSAVEKQRLEEEIDRLRGIAYRDELTGVFNRHGIKDVYEPFFNDTHYLRSRSGVHREHVRIDDIGIIFIDIDNFKIVNDTKGHDEGDKILKEISVLLDENVRGIDGVGRWGGEEFVLILLGADENESYKKAEELRRLIEKETDVTGSFGVASLSSCRATSLGSIISCADKAMYEAKHNRGKNTVVRHSELS